MRLSLTLEDKLLEYNKMPEKVILQHNTPLTDDKHYLFYEEFKK